VRLWRRHYPGLAPDLAAHLAADTGMSPEEFLRQTERVDLPGDAELRDHLAADVGAIGQGKSGPAAEVTADGAWSVFDSSVAD
jgi:hypothetical protein